MQVCPALEKAPQAAASAAAAEPGAGSQCESFASKNATRQAKNALGEPQELSQLS